MPKVETYLSNAAFMHLLKYANERKISTNGKAAKRIIEEYFLMQHKIDKEIAAAQEETAERLGKALKKAHKEVEQLKDENEKWKERFWRKESNEKKDD